MTTRETSTVRYSLFWERDAQYEMQYLSTWEVRSLQVRRRGKQYVINILFDENGWMQESYGKVLRLWSLQVSSLRYDVKTGVLIALSNNEGEFYVHPENRIRDQNNRYVMDSFNFGSL